MAFCASFMDALFINKKYEIYELLSWHISYLLCNVVELNHNKQILTINFNFGFCTWAGKYK